MCGSSMSRAGANIADLPSRGKFELLREMGSKRFEIELPDIGGDWTDVFTRVFKRLAPRPTAGAKRAHAEIETEIARLRAASG